MPIDPKRVESLFEQARTLATPEREAFLAAECGGDPDLRARVERLLAAEVELGEFLEHEAQGHTPPGGSGSDDPAIPRTLVAPAGYTPPPSPAQSAEILGTLIAGKYRLVEKIAEGGMGAVYMAQQTEPVKRLVAVKLIKAGMDSGEVLARFEAERQAVAMMDHPNIARVLDAGTTETGSPFFVMELVKGVPITRFCDERKLTPRERLELFVPVCQAIQHAHQKGIIHRDIKPSNVLVALYDDRAVPKVIDFGVAKAVKEQLTDFTLVTGYRAVLGTPAYMSPEQAGFNQMDVDTRSDVYSLGVLLYELLTGTTPIDRKTLARAAWLEVLRIVREVEPPKPSHRLSTTDALPNIAANRNTEPAKLGRLMKGELDWVVMKALEKDRNRRYETANGFAHDIQRYLADEVVHARPPSAGYKFRKFVRRNRGQVLAAGLVLLSLVGGFIGTTYGMIQARRSEAVAVGALGEKDDALKDANAERVKAVLATDEAVAQKKRADEKADEAGKNAVAAARSAEEARNQAKEAKDQLAISKALTGLLLKDLLPQADRATFAAIGRAAVANPTMRDVLDNAARSLAPGAIEARFPNQPLVQAQILETVGETYRGIGEYDKAIAHLRRAADLWQAEYGPDNQLSLAAVLKIGAAYLAAGKYPEALAVFEKIHESWVNKLEPNEPNTLLGIAAMNDLARVYVSIGRSADAIKLFEPIRGSVANRFGPRHEYTLTITHNLATAYEAGGNPAEAIRLLESVRDARLKNLGPKHPNTLGTLNALGVAYLASGRATEAADLFQQVFDDLLARVGPTHRATLMTQINLARAYQKSGRLAEALAIYEQAVPAARKAEGLGPDNPVTRTFTRHWISALEEGNQLARVVDIRRELLAVERKVYLPDDPRLAESLALLGLALLNSNKPADAEPVLRESLAIRERKDPDGWVTSSTRSMLGGSLLGQKKYADAGPLLLAGYEGMKQLVGSKEPPPQSRLAEAADRLVEFSIAVEKPADGAKWRAERDRYPYIAPAPRPVIK